MQGELVHTECVGKYHAKRCSLPCLMGKNIRMPCPSPLWAGPVHLSSYFWP